GASVGQRPGYLAVATRLEGAGVDPLVIPGIDVSRVANALRIGGSLLRQQRDLVFGKPELVERRDIEVLGQLVDVFHADLGGLVDGLVRNLETQRLGDSGKALRLAGVVLLHDWPQKPAGQRAVRRVWH